MYYKFYIIKIIYMTFDGNTCLPNLNFPLLYSESLVYQYVYLRKAGHCWSRESHSLYSEARITNACFFYLIKLFIWWCIFHLNVLNNLIICQYSSAISNYDCFDANYNDKTKVSCYTTLKALKNLKFIQKNLAMKCFFFYHLYPESYTCLCPQRFLLLLTQFKTFCQVVISRNI